MDSVLAKPPHEELEFAFNGLYERNPWAFALKHHARVYKSSEAVIWLNGEVSGCNLPHIQSYCLLILELLFPVFILRVRKSSV